MRVTQELVSVLPDPMAGEIHVVLAGHKISLSSEEGSLLARAISAALERLAAAAEPGGGWTVRRAPVPMPAASPAPSPEPAETRAEADAMQQRTRALVQAMMREKGLALRGDEP